MKTKLVATYFILILITLFLISVYMLNILSEYSFNRRSVELLTQANILASFAAESDFEEGYNNVAPLIGMLNVAEDSRVIYLDKDAKVIYDTSQTANLNGKTMAEEQIINALGGQNDTKKIEDGDAIYIGTAVPVTRAGTIVGAIYLQSRADDLGEFYRHFRNSLFLLSIVVCLLAGFVSFAMANVFTAPIMNLTTSITNMSETDSRKPVDITGSKEIDQLVTAFNTMVEKINNMDNKRQEFVSNASHELKTPLSSIKLICDSLIQNSDIDRLTINEFLGDMNSEVDRLTRIINKLLVLTKIDTSISEHNSTEFKTINLKTLTEGVVKALLPLAQHKKIELSTNIKEEIFVSVDPDKIWEAVYNILDNSIKYTPENGNVYIEQYRNEGKIYINIVDSGIGMATEEKSKIFDRFYRVDKARARSTGGTGLGLSIALSSIALHGGTIEVESREDEGSLFKIILPSIGHVEQS